MALKLEVSALEDLPEAFREHYARNDAGLFEITVEDAQPLRNSFATEKRHRKKAEATVRELETQLADVRGKPRPKPESEMTARERLFAQAGQRLAGLEGEARAAELAKIDAEAQAVLDAEVAEHEQKLRAKFDAGERQIVGLRREQAAQSILRDLARPDCDTVLLPHVLKRIGVEKRGEDWAVFAVDTDGKPSAMTMDALKEDLRSAPHLKPLVIGASAQDAAVHARKVAETLGTRTPPTLTRDAYARLSPLARNEHVAAGGTIEDSST